MQSKPRFHFLWREFSHPPIISTVPEQPAEWRTERRLLFTKLTPIMWQTVAAMAFSDKHCWFWWCVPESSDASLPSRRSEISQLSCGISRRHAPFLSSSLGILRVDREQWWRSQEKSLRPWRDLFYFYLYHVGHFNALTHLITLLLYSDYQFMHCTVLLWVQYNVK